ncbi:GNAT family N-acetyltransferase [Bacillus sp. ISL-35]|uniref:GNAT family N-acetyltransferase n=1 Tax=Bacillus sp. ISL-35 TaxID=2819122 RepID=UPI001BE8F585|nr:GNAT family N-acetyltransferase [Bacillus sp. ISL-35]MBT2680200.1 GNAT family N-acetyltransferase [Bacillus sp. ISL-35]MBT2704474.1 GNAT family N-acetyltransferase [Chryseobacterium sp. ISL-80]
MSVAKNETVSLQLYNNEFKSCLLNYTLLDEQRRFTALPAEALEKCEEEPDRHPVVILYEEQPAGFFVLHGKEGVKTYSENQNAMLLRAYSINLPYQGKGIASESIKLLKQFAKEHFPLVNEIILAVNHSNIMAQNVYKKGGFIDQGKRAMGREGEMFIYHLQLEEF